jgi:glutathione S-transferase
MSQSLSAGRRRESVTTSNSELASRRPVHTFGSSAAQSCAPLPTADSKKGAFVTQAKQNPLKLYELVLANGRSMSPFVWRVRYALAHKSLPVETIGLGFTEISSVCSGRFKTVPIIEDGASAVCDSWDIVDYLERTYPARPLFATPGEYASTRFFDAWFNTEVLRRMFGICALNIHDCARPEDQPYFRSSREARLKTTLEAFVADRQARLPQLREALTPLRQHLARYPFIGGEAPNYADYIALGAFQWVGSVCDIPMLAANDALAPWLDRGFDLYGGIGRDTRMKALLE